MQEQKHVLSCDWGTSSFRLRLIDTSANKCLDKVESDDGNASVFNQWKAQSDIDRISFYLAYLKQAIAALSTRARVNIDDAPILISGMASSSIGMKELPYAELPFMLNGSSAYAEWIVAGSEINNPLLLISGAQQSDDVMRGEEIQLAGLASLTNLPIGDETLFILPGTHSKHITVMSDRIVHFKTFMTGEIFEIIARHSILAHAVTRPESKDISDEEKSAFRKGVSKALESELLNSLFSVRINQLKKYLSPTLNYFYLSGLLIGSEIKYLVNHTNNKLMLCSSGHLQRLYYLALDCAGLLQKTMIVAPETLDNAAAAGQLLVYRNMISKNV